MKSRYLTKLWLEDLDGNTFIVCAPFKYYSELFGSVFVVPIETEIDFASIPFPFKMIWPKSGKYNKAAALHDAGYKNKLVGPIQFLNKENYDKIFNEAMKLSEVNGFQRKVMFRMVSWFGRKSEEN